ISISNLGFNYPEITLPVSLSLFTVKSQNDIVKLNWTTVSENNNSHFEPLRSRDGIKFSKIGVVDGAGNSDQERSYTYTDYAPFSGISYYQLNQVDFDGTSTVSEIRSVKTKLKVDDMFSVFLDREKNLEISAYAGKDTKGTL